MKILYNSGVGLKKCSDTQILRAAAVAIAGSVVCLFTAAAEGCGGYSF